MSEFDIRRAILEEEPETAPLLVEGWVSLREKQSDLAQTTTLLVAEVNNATLALPTLHMIYSHVAEGQHGETPFMASFCVLCNAGMVFSPLVDGKLHHFAAQGYYNAMILLADQETQSYWDHLTGECLHGPLQGQRLTPLSSLRVLSVAETINAHPDVQLALGKFSSEYLATAERWRLKYHLPPNPDFGTALLATLDKEDMRLPRYDMGLGIWQGESNRYYSVLSLNSHENVIIDEFNGQRVLVYMDLETGFPGAFYTDATVGRWRFNELYLDNGDVFQQGVLRNKNGQYLVPQRPSQLAIRWYAFSTRFPHCEIYG